MGYFFFFTLIPDSEFFCNLLNALRDAFYLPDRHAEPLYFKLGELVCAEKKI
ncbi:hypothetical protein [Candidatus Methanoperedens nitratireducens]|uniref:hypothetical protein n=1 Tax=Candidatus Methanoperedens nitratireducens TaxID=1392998 RepID=UPI0015CCD558|nr:hypothetical protein [Candidatus Methanoperedens nitroreducens]